MNVRTILVPLDFSDCSPALVSDAVSLAGSLGAEIVLLNVIEAPSGVPAGAVIRTEDGPTTAYMALEHEAATRLDAVDTGDVASRRLTWRGKPVESILAASAQVSADMVIMGTHGRRGVAHLVLGSVAERVVRESMIPVLTVRAIHRRGCEANSCNWCQVKGSALRDQIGVEADG